MTLLRKAPGRRKTILVVMAALVALAASTANAAPKKGPKRPTTTTTPTSSTTTSTTTTSVPTPTTTSTTTSTTTPGTGPVVPAGTVTRNGAQLMLDGAPYRFTGINAFSLSTTATTKHSCGAYVSDADVLAFFNSLRPNSMVRIYAFQVNNQNSAGTGLDWASTDRLVRLANQSSTRVRLIPAILGGGNDCSDNMSFTRTTDGYWTGGYKTYRDTFAGATNTITDYDYLRQVVTRYAGNPAVGMWEVIGEGRIDSCHPDADKWTRAYFDDLGTLIHSLDPTKLVESGALSDLQCGWKDWAYVHQSPGIDVASWHDYGYDAEAMPTRMGNALAITNNINKPFIVGEVGSYARDGIAGCDTLARRHDLFKAKMDALYANGGDGWVPWNWAQVATECDHYIKSDDPSFSLLRDYSL